MNDSELINKKIDGFDNSNSVQTDYSGESNQIINSKYQIRSKVHKWVGVGFGIIIVVLVLVGAFNYINFVFIGPQTPDFVTYLREKYNSNENYYLVDERGAWYSPTDYIKCFSADSLNGKSFCVEADRDEKNKWGIAYSDQYFSVKYKDDIDDYLQNKFASPFYDLVPGRTTVKVGTDYHPYLDKTHSDVSLDEYISKMNDFFDDYDRYSRGPVYVYIYLDYSDYSVESFSDIDSKAIREASRSIFWSFDESPDGNVRPSIDMIFKLKDDKEAGVCPYGLEKYSHSTEEKGFILCKV